jgi:glycosyltransferase involved in cell wall biosynthesis
MHQFKLSLIIPIYNVDKYLKSCLESVVSQTYNNIQVILIDDGSTDDSFEIAKSTITLHLSAKKTVEFQLPGTEAW